MLWNQRGATNALDGPDAATVLDEIARIGFEGTQFGTGFPEGARLRDELASRRLRLAEVYLPIPATADGPRADALDVALEHLRLLHDAGGDVLCVAIDGSAERDASAGRAGSSPTPVFTDAAWTALTALLHELADAATALGHVTVFHPHAGTFVETPAEVDRLLASTDAARVGICIDVGHHIVGGGDAVGAVRGFGHRYGTSISRTSTRRCWTGCGPVGSPVSATPSGTDSSPSSAPAPSTLTGSSRRSSSATMMAG
jgi:inosose dehydratase